MQFLHFFVSGLLLTYIGYMIHFRDKAEWIAGFENSSIKNRKRLTTIIGLTSMVMGVVLLIMPLLLMHFPPLRDWHSMIYAGIVISGAFIMVIGSNSIK